EAAEDVGAGGQLGRVAGQRGPCGAYVVPRTQPVGERTPGAAEYLPGRLQRTHDLVERFGDGFGVAAHHRGGQFRTGCCDAGAVTERTGGERTGEGVAVDAGRQRGGEQV